MGIDEKILDCCLHFVATIFTVSGILLWLRRKGGDRSRIFLAFICLMSILAFGGRLFGLFPEDAKLGSILPITNLRGGLLAIIILYSYPIEVINPGWLNLKRGALMLIPWAMVAVITLLTGAGFRALTSFDEMLQYISEPNVWFRLLIILMVIPYATCIYVIPRQWMKSGATNRWITFYTLTVLCVSLLWAIFMLTGSPLVSSIHSLFFMMFCMGTTYQELFLRIRVPMRIEEQMPVPVAQDEAAAVEDTEEHPLWVKLSKLMKERQPWRNPDFTLENLVSLLATNHTTLLGVIQDKGFSGYKEYINRIRIDEYLKIVNNEPYVSSQEAFFRVGYRSRMTALRYFRQYVGCSPSEYLNRLSDDMQE